MTLKTDLSPYFLLLISLSSFGQVQQYNYKKEILNVSDEWHKIILPTDIYSKISTDFSDLRVMGITTNDTLELPYLLNPLTDKVSNLEIPFNLINQSQNQKGYFFTFEITNKQTINQLKLDFNQTNFDWKVAIEGSHNQTEWFSLANNYRILSINNDLTNYSFTTVNFPKSNYRYYRLSINSNEQPKLISATTTLQEISYGTSLKYPIHKLLINELKKDRQIILYVHLNSVSPLSSVTFDVTDKIDYYRPVIIQYLKDSSNTEQGWKYNYQTIKTGILNSFDGNEFKFESTFVKTLKIIIENNDNQPLTINSIQAKGVVHEVITRLNNAHTYFLVYGNKNAELPDYDLKHFNNKIPHNLVELKLGKEISLAKTTHTNENDLFKNKNWLWAVMVIIIIILGWFTFKMMDSK